MVDTLTSHPDRLDPSLDLIARQRRAAFPLSEKAFTLQTILPTHTYQEALRTPDDYMAPTAAEKFGLRDERADVSDSGALLSFKELSPIPRPTNAELFDQASQATQVLAFEGKSPVTIRPATLDDVEMIRAMYREAPEGDLVMRFFATLDPDMAADEAIKHSTLGRHSDGRDFVAIAAGDDETPERAVAFAGYSVSQHGQPLAIPHILVAKEYQGAHTKSGNSVAKQVFLDALLAAQYDPSTEGIYQDTLPDNRRVNMLFDRVIGDDRFGIASQRRFFEDGVCVTKVVFDSDDKS